MRRWPLREDERMRNTYKTVVNAVYVYDGDNQEVAIRAWDRESVRRTDLVGGIMIQSFDDDGIMIRDGWLLHVSESGHVYLNPRI